MAGLLVTVRRGRRADQAAGTLIVSDGKVEPAFRDDIDAVVRGVQEAAGPADADDLAGLQPWLPCTRLPQRVETTVGRDHLALQRPVGTSRGASCCLTECFIRGGPEYLRATATMHV